LAALIDAVERTLVRGDDPCHVQYLLLRLAKGKTDHFAAERDLMQAPPFAERKDRDNLLQDV